jgi:molybdenum cofactor biosynthesis enzyme MoaA
MTLPTTSPALVSIYHVTVASNFGRAFDKYSGCYDKAALPHSTYPGRFFVLERAELGIGIAKATRLLAKLNLPGDRLLVLEARVAPDVLQPNQETGTGLGQVLAGDRLAVAAVYWVSPAGELVDTTVEEVAATALRSLAPELQSYASLAPRTLSVLPIARACQAACRFCFSESSASLEQRARLADIAGTERWMAPAVVGGADRFVITGGGEPGLLAHDSLVELMAAGARHFPTVVLITNGVHLARAVAARRAQMLLDYARAGLTVLAISRHHADPDTNAAIMGLNTGTEEVLGAWRDLRSRGQLPAIRLRLICVLQQGGVATLEDIAAFLAFAAREGAHEVCFKELYVSTTLESGYHDRPENAWSRAHQVPLARLTSALSQLDFEQAGTLPWGSPLYSGAVSLPDGTRHTLRVAAYTEPSLYWERTRGIARSWNLMADGTCLASLEDPDSQLALPGAPARRVIRIAPTSATPESSPSKCP